jgi:hypothetical protein
VAQYENFYENIKEADMRLRNTLVMYDGKPYVVLCISDHNKDGILRIYLDEIGTEKGCAYNRIPMPYSVVGEVSSSLHGKYMDEWLKGNPEEGVIRKKMNSPLFNKFRPFPLGMCNYRETVMFLERCPTRHTQQGLTESMLGHRPVGLHGKNERSLYRVGLCEKELKHTICGEYPDVITCLSGLQDSSVLNSGAAFSRKFAFVRGPLNFIFLAYKDNVVGYLPNGDLSSVVVGSEFEYTKEAVAALNVFEDIKIK